MMNIEFKRLTEINISEIIELMNNPLVRRHMPLAQGYFDETACSAFIAAKDQIWKEHGYGPWAFVVAGTFVGWGGLQPEHNDVEVALVLHPKSWGLGKTLFDEIVHRAFTELGLSSVVVLFPPSRTRVKALLRSGFQHDGECEIEGKQFLRYRLYAK